MKINSFEDLLVWQKSRELANEIYKLTEKFPIKERYNLIDEIGKMINGLIKSTSSFRKY